MSRSNDPKTQTGGEGHQWRHLAELDLALRIPPQAPHQPQQWPEQWRTQAPSNQPQYASPGQGSSAYPGQHAPQPPSYHYPQSAPLEAGYGLAGAPSAAQTSAFSASSPAQSGGHRAYAPQFDRYLSSQSQALDAHRGSEPAPMPNQGPFISRPAVAADEQGFAPVQSGPTMRPELRGTTYDQWPASHDRLSYDLGNYMPSAVANQGAYQADQPAGVPHVGPQWHDRNGFGIPLDDPAAALANYGHPHGGNEPLPGAAQSQDQEDADYEVDEPRRRYRGVAIVAALVVAVAVGGGLAYTYKTVLGPATNTVPPIVKADNRPAKTQPADPGGKQFAHKDSKLMGRLGEDSSVETSAQALASASSDTEALGVRKVSTLVVGRDGSIAAPAVEGPARLPPPTVAVPGMTIVDGFEGRGSAAMPASPRPIERAPQPAGHAQRASAASSTATVRPQVISKVNPTSTPVASEAATGPSSASQPKKAPPGTSATVPQTSAFVAAAPPPKKTAFKETSAGSALAAKSGSAGYVVVLSSQKSRMDALKTFADLQQKYGSVLENKVPDVQEADLSAKGLGTVYRVVVGPPGSRESANDICGQLKSAGYSGCWVTTY